MASPNEWHRYDFPLKFRVGEVSLGTYKIPVMRKVFHVAEIVAQAPVPPWPELEQEVKGVLLVCAPHAALAGEITLEKDWISYCLKSYRHCLIDLRGDFDGYQSRFSGKTRSTLKRKVRKFAEVAGGLDFRCYTAPEQMAEFHAHARAVSALTYQERLLDYGLPSHAGFVDDLRAQARLDQVRGYLLFAKGRPVSYLYCPIVDGVVEYAFLGYDPDWAKLSPGTVLQWLALESQFSEGRFSTFDFTEGESDHKLFFSTQQVNCNNRLLVRRSLFHSMLIRSHRWVDRTSSGIGDQLERLGMKARLKKWLRSRA